MSAIVLLGIVSMGNARGLGRHVPKSFRPPLRAMRSAARKAWAVTLTAVRARALGTPGSWWLGAIPPTLRSRWLIPLPAPGLRRVEVGSGQRPRPGYIHVDLDAESPGVDLLAAGDRLPLPSGWADEVLTVHAIEHLAPGRLRAALGEWHRVLRAGGVLRIHTPNAEALGRALQGAASADGGRYWAVQSAIFGYGCHPLQCTRPESLGGRPTHTVLFTFAALKDLLEAAGFAGVEDVSGKDPCDHLVEWAPYVADLCLEVEATSVPPVPNR